MLNICCEIKGKDLLILMSSKKWFLIFSVCFVVLMIGAGVLYDELSNTVERESLVTTEKNKVTNTPTEPPKQSESEQTNTTQENEATEETSIAPDFTVVDGEGNEHKLSDFFGKPIVLNFWASWCGPCKSEMPDFDEVYAEYKEDIHFLMVNLTDGNRETVSSAKEFIEEQGYSFPVYYDTKLEAMMAYYAYSIPMTFFINAEGEMIAYAQSAISKEVLLQGIEMIVTVE